MAEVTRSTATQPHSEKRKSKTKLEVFENILEQFPFPLVSYALDGTVTKVNRAWELLWHDHRSHAIGYNILDDPHLDANGVLDTVRKAFDGEHVVIEAIEYDPALIGRTGRKRWIRMIFFPLKDKDEHLTEVLLFLRDVTDIKEAEIALSQSEQRWKRLIESSDEGLVLLDHEGHVTYQSPAAERITGFKAQDMRGKPSIEMVHPEDVSRAGEMMERALANPGIPQRSTHRVKHKLGHWIWTQGTLSNQLDELGVKALVGNFRDITERMQSEVTLRESEEKFRSLTQTAFDAIVLINEQGRITFWNHGARAIFGYEESEVIDRQLTMIMPERYRSKHSNGLARFLETGENRVIGNVVELEGLRKNEEEFPIEISITSWTSSGGRVFSGIIRDISERKKAEQQLKHNEQRLASVYDTVADVIFILEVEGKESYRFSSVNKSFLRTTGVPPEAVVGRYVHEVIPEPSLTMVLGKYRQAIEGRKIMRWEETSRYPTGELTGEVSVAPVFDDDGRCLRLIGAVHDITERRRAEQNYKEIFEKANDAIYIHEIETGRVLAVNDRACEISGFTKEEILNGNPEQLMAGTPGFTLEDAMNHLQRAANGERETFEWQARHKNGSLFWVEVSLTRATIGGQDRILAFFREIGDRKEQERKIKSLNRSLEKKVAKRTEQLEQANRELEAFSYTVAHDLRAPLRAIHGFTRILSEEHSNGFDDEAQGMMRFVLDGVKKMDILISDLLRFSQLSRQPINKEAINMQALVESVLTEYADEIRTRSAECYLDQLPPASADPATMKQVWGNLISNALKYSARKDTTEIRISGWTTADEVMYVVRDNGCGFDMRFYDKLFGIFQRLHSQEEFEGTGVGLAIVSRVVTRHGGRVWAEAVLNQGASFYFSLPNSGTNEQ